MHNLISSQFLSASSNQSLYHTLLALRLPPLFILQPHFSFLYPSQHLTDSRCRRETTAGRRATAAGVARRAGRRSAGGWRPAQRRRWAVDSGVARRAAVGSPRRRRAAASGAVAARRAPGLADSRARSTRASRDVALQRALPLFFSFLGKALFCSLLGCV